MDKSFAKMLPLLIIGEVLIAVGMGLHATNLTAIPYIVEGAGIIAILVFAVLVGALIGKNKKQH